MNIVFMSTAGSTRLQMAAFSTSAKDTAREMFSRKKGNVLFRNIVAKIKRQGGEPVIERWHEGLLEADALRLEITYIRLFGRRNNGTGILSNLTDGGDGVSGLVVSEETRAKLSEWGRSKTLTEEHSKKIGDALRGRIFSEEHRAKIGAAGRGRIASSDARSRMSQAKFGKKFSDEHRLNMSASLRMRPPRGEHKGVFFQKSSGKWVAQIFIEKYHRIGVFLTAEDAALAYDKAAIAAFGIGGSYLNFGPPATAAERTSQ